MGNIDPYAKFRYNNSDSPANIIIGFMEEKREENLNLMQQVNNLKIEINFLKNIIELEKDYNQRLKKEIEMLENKIKETYGKI